MDSLHVRWEEQFYVKRLYHSTNAEHISIVRANRLSEHETGASVIGQDNANEKICYSTQAKSCTSFFGRPNLVKVRLLA